ncbi:MAG TPA: NADP-dependent oxidoreductase [Chthoniobacterales bacterium]|jgi:NADPH:quinone reductase-like Zn-dependent oxidoreductase
MPGRLSLLLYTLTISLPLGSISVAAGDQPMMKAVVAHEYGAPEVLKFENVPRPEPEENQALVKVIASGVNPADPLTLSGKYAKEFGTHLPLIPGYDIAGIVEKVGAKVTKLKVGEAVYGYPTFGGGWAEYVTVTEGEVAAKPKSLTFAEAAAVPMGALTAWQALVDTAHLAAGQTVLIHGGSGGVGSFAVQIAKLRGARVVATASSANQDLLRQLGVDQPIDYTTTKFEETAPDVDVVLDPVGKETLKRSYGIVKKGGILMTLVSNLDKAELEKHGIRGAGIAVHPDAEDLAEIAQLIDAGKIKPIVTRVLPLSAAIAVQRQAATHHTRGKIVLQIADEPKTEETVSETRE